MSQAETLREAGYDAGGRGQDRPICAASTEGSRPFPSLEERGVSRDMGETFGYKEPILLGGFPAGKPRNF